MLGSDISVYTGKEEIVMDASTLSRNFDKTVLLMKEIMLEPRWDSTEFILAQTRTRNSIIQSEAQPRSVANKVFFRLLYGKEHILGYSIKGNQRID